MEGTIWRILGGDIFLAITETIFRIQAATLKGRCSSRSCGRSSWAVDAVTMLMAIVAPLMGTASSRLFSLYGEGQRGPGWSRPVLAASLSGRGKAFLVPTLGASYVAVTLLFSCFAIRVLGQDQESGALSILIQLPLSLFPLIAAKLAAVAAAWVLSKRPPGSRRGWPLWRMLDGHLFVGGRSGKP